MANQSSDDEVFDFSNTEFTREDLITALNEMVHEYKKLSQTFEEVKAENMDLKNSSVEPNTVQLGETDSLQIELSKLKTENESLRLRSCELESENERLKFVMSSWTQSSVSFSKLQESQKPLNDKSGLGFNAGESSSGETCTQSNLAYDKFKKMNFVKSVIHDTCESVQYDDQISSWTQSSVSFSKLQESQKPLNDKSGLGFNAGESSSGETCTQSNLAYDKFKKMNFVKSVIHDTCESVQYDDQISGKQNQKGKADIGYVRPENSKSSWLKNRLGKEKARVGSKSFVQNQQRRGSKKVKSEWRKVQLRRDLNGQDSKPKLNRSHHIPAHTLVGIQWRIRIPFPGGAAEIKSSPEKCSIHSKTNKHS
ncbi:hypothetical protein F511_44261 [Dorcoceras hygrometricum]|uniref:Uncharacterized protein n=1 Tax=Dorcoceras hygrometricum TaxID=472368 RepID=A0A2Z7B761_9LAMI|nr:hypothetical protein F511_44261 [Dorcoceras hygrometricum]